MNICALLPLPWSEISVTAVIITILNLMIDIQLMAFEMKSQVSIFSSSWET